MLSFDLDLLFAAAARTSAMLLLKVRGMAEELEVSEFLKSWLLLDLEPDELVLLATSEVLPSVGPLLDDDAFCFNVGSLSNCIKF